MADWPEHEHDDGVITESEKKLKPPPLYKVLLHNDDYTTMEFVVHILMEHFQKSRTEAVAVMLHVHTKGVGVAGVFTRDVAETKSQKVMALAREHGMPLLCTTEPE